MGVPKFFRWLSERYPAISQLIAENRIPEFDCLYLDMNGIIHNCTHKESDSVAFRMTEDKMFIAIFNYIEHLFGKIKPKKLFFMAVDGMHVPRSISNLRCCPKSENESTARPKISVCKGCRRCPKKSGFKRRGSSRGAF